MRNHPRVLVIANECISNVSSNGRTLRNFLLGWPKEKLAQFCIRNTAPDFSLCDHYYYVSDRDALRSLVKGVRVSGKMVQAEGIQNQTTKAGGRNALTMLMRNCAWNSMRWAGPSFYSWVEDFDPELILLQAGDCAFMLNLAEKLAKKYNIPLVIYNSEAYYFKNYDYFRSTGVAKLFYPIFYRQFRRAFERCMRIAQTSVYCCDKLKTDYDRYFDVPSDVIYTVSQMEPANVPKNHRPLQLSYLGNLGVGRHEGLVEIANALQRISPDLKLDVYGKIPNQAVQMAFDQCNGIRHHGFVPYEKVVDIIHNSDVVVHTESFTDFYREDLKYAFSTKIADSLASGTCFLLYAPEEMACTEYLREHDAAWVISKKEELQTILERLCDNQWAREQYIQSALLLARQNHSPKENTERFQTILRESVKER